MNRPNTPTYKTLNWPAFNKTLKRRGSRGIWFDPDMVWAAHLTGKRGRQPKHLPRIVEVIELDSLTCACGGCLHCIGEDISERLDIRFHAVGDLVGVAEGDTVDRHAANIAAELAMRADPRQRTGSEATAILPPVNHADPAALAAMTIMRRRVRACWSIG
ncbi:MAG: hypothetical protein U1B82_21840, partial [Cypionkella sp.]|nr:hypothetical protein [Cypionkella sp.]